MANAIDDPAIQLETAFDLDAALNEVAGHLNAQHAQLVDLTVTMLDDETLWVGEGAHTIELFLAWRTGLAPQRARQVASIARRIGDLPECIDAFRRGELAVDQMAAIAARAPWWTDSEVCGLAKLLTVGQLRRTLARYPFPEIEPPADDPTSSDCDGGADTAADHPPVDDADDDSSTTRRTTHRTTRGPGTAAHPTPGPPRRPSMRGGASATTACSASISRAIP